MSQKSCLFYDHLIYHLVYVAVDVECWLHIVDHLTEKLRTTYSCSRPSFVTNPCDLFHSKYHLGIFLPDLEEVHG